MSMVPRVTAALLLCLVALPASVRAQAADAGWQTTGLTMPVTQLFAPSSGALLARDQQHLYRSDDAGVTWRGVQLPARPSFWRPIAVAPTDHDVLFASSANGLARSTDGGGTWQDVVTASSPGLPEHLGPGPIKPIAV